MTENKASGVQPKEEQISVELGIDCRGNFDDTSAARRAQLNEGLAHFESKVQELENIDPLDFTGPNEIYVKHGNRIRELPSDSVALPL